jgi:hypothetical protein
MQGSLHSATVLYGDRIAQAFPLIRHLHLDKVHVPATAIQALASCLLLSELYIEYCTTDTTITSDASSAAALAQLPSLTSLTLNHCTPLMTVTSTASRLTQLEVYATQPVDEIRAAVQSLPPQLQHLELSTEPRRGQAGMVVPDGSAIRKSLISCPGLTYFWTWNVVDQQGLEALLTHGRKLKDVHVAALRLTSNVACGKCTLDHLTVSDHGPNWQLTWSRLPSQVGVRTRSPPSHLCLPVLEVPASQQQQVLQTAASHLTAILQQSAWRKHCLTLGINRGPGDMSFDWDLLFALPPLDSYITDLQVLVADPDLSFGSQAVTALGRGLGRSLTRLTLHQCKLDPSFWSDVLDKLPALTVLQLGVCVQGAVSHQDMTQLAVQGHSRTLDLHLIEDIRRNVSGGWQGTEGGCRVRVHSYWSADDDYRGARRALGP